MGLTGWNNRKSPLLGKKRIWQMHQKFDQLNSFGPSWSKRCMKITGQQRIKTIWSEELSKKCRRLNPKPSPIFFLVSEPKLSKQAEKALNHCIIDTEHSQHIILNHILVSSCLNLSVSKIYVLNFVTITLHQSLYTTFHTTNLCWNKLWNMLWNILFVI